MSTGRVAPIAMSPIGWCRFCLRLLALLAWLCLCAGMDVIWRLFSPAKAPVSPPWPRRFLAGLNRICRVRVSLTGRRAGGTEFILANHVSWLDIPVLGAATGTAFVAHDGLAAVPLLRWLCKRNDTVFVARSRRGTVAAQVEQVRTALADTGALTLFAEGTTSDGTAILPLKSALLSAIEPLPLGIAVQPVLIDYGADTAQIAWVGEEHGAVNFRRMLARRDPVMVTLCFLPVLAGPELTNRKTMAAAVQAALTQELERRQGGCRVAETLTA